MTSDLWLTEIIYDVFLTFWYKGGKLDRFNWVIQSRPASTCTTTCILPHTWPFKASFFIRRFPISWYTVVSCGLSYSKILPNLWLDNVLILLEWYSFINMFALYVNPHFARICQDFWLSSRYSQTDWQLSVLSVWHPNSIGINNLQIPSCLRQNRTRFESQGLRFHSINQSGWSIVTN